MTKQDFKRKWENYWYYYKWHTLGGILALALIIFFVKDMVSREQYDATLLFCTSYYVGDEQTAELEKQAERYISDIDGDGVVNVAITPIFIARDKEGNTTDPQTAYAMQVKMMSTVSADPTLIYIFDQDYYDTFTKDASLRRLSDDFSGNAQVEGMVWRIGESDYGKETFLKDYFTATGKKLYAAMGTGSNISKPAEKERYNKIFEGFANMVNHKALSQ